MRNCTLKIVKGNSLFSLLIVALWVLPICISCKSENLDNVRSSSGSEVSKREEIIAEETWICAGCGEENNEALTMCQQCSLARQQESHVQSQMAEEDLEATQAIEKNQEKEEIQEKDSEASNLEEEECPVCLEKLTQKRYSYWICGHLLCKICYDEIKVRSEKGDLRFCCPICRNGEPSKEASSDLHATYQ